MRGYSFQRLYETRNYSLKEHEAVFLNSQTLVAGSVWFVFCFGLDIFTNKISNLPGP